MLLTRSPLYAHPKVSYPFDLHVLSTPPAFILSQDQTLRSKMGRAPLPSPESLIRHCPAHGVPIGGAAGPRGDPSSSISDFDDASHLFEKFRLPQYPVFKVPPPPRRGFGRSALPCGAR